MKVKLSKEIGIEFEELAKMLAPQLRDKGILRSLDEVDIILPMYVKDNENNPPRVNGIRVITSYEYENVER